MGTRPTPSHLAVLRGAKWDPRSMAIEPAADPGRVPPPADLVDPEAREVWMSLAPELERKALLGPRYQEPFRQLVEAIVARRRAGKRLLEEGPVVDGVKGQPVTNPALRAWRQTGDMVLRLSMEFALTPAAVASLGRNVAQIRSGEDTHDPRRILSG